MLNIQMPAGATAIPSKHAQLEGLDRLQRRMQKLVRKYGQVEDVIVGYTQYYAIYVHENTRMALRGQPRKKPSIGRYWDPPGSGPKFLEAPARELARVIGSVVVTALKKGGSTFQDALLKGGQYLQHQSQKRVPVDFGALIASAYTAKESQEERVASQVHAQSEFLRAGR